MDKRKILIVDDETDSGTMLKLALEKCEEYEVRAITDGRKILNVIKKFYPDIILLDLIMPNMGGLDVCSLLNTTEAGKDIPIIILSAFSGEAVRAKAYKLGVVDYIEKPIENEALIAKIKKVLDVNKKN